MVFDVIVATDIGTIRVGIGVVIGVGLLIGLSWRSRGSRRGHTRMTLDELEQLHRRAPGGSTISAPGARSNVRRIVLSSGDADAEVSEAELQDTNRDVMEREHRNDH